MLKFALPKIYLGFVLKRLYHACCQLALPVLILVLVSGYFLQSPTAVLAIEQNIQFVLPHTGYLSTFFSAYHPGVDLATDLGTPIHPISSGIVENVIFDTVDYGNHIILDHSNGYKSLYGHLGKIFVKKGESVGLNTILGEVGLTGHTSGPHTHLEIIKDENYLDPLIVLPKSLQLSTLSSALSVGGMLPKPKEASSLSKTLKPDFF